MLVFHVTYILHKLGEVELVERIDGVAHCRAGGRDCAIKLVHGARDELGRGENVVLQEVHLLGQLFIVT